MSKKVTIEIPDDCELVHTGEGKWEVRKEEKKLPKTWEGFCKTHPVKEDEYYINPGAGIAAFGKLPDGLRSRDPLNNKDILPNKETAEAIHALMQLIQLRDCYNGDWVPDWADGESWKYNIELSCDKIVCSMSKTDSRVLAFRTMDLRDQFFKNFRDLIEIAKPLI